MTDATEPAWHAKARAMGWTRDATYLKNCTSGVLGHLALHPQWRNGTQYRCDACMQAEVEAHEKTHPTGGHGEQQTYRPGGTEVFDFAGEATALCASLGLHDSPERLARITTSLRSAYYAASASWLRSARELADTIDCASDPADAVRGWIDAMTGGDHG